VNISVTVSWFSPGLQLLRVEKIVSQRLFPYLSVTYTDDINRGKICPPEHSGKKKKAGFELESC